MTEKSRFRKSRQIKGGLLIPPEGLSEEMDNLLSALIRQMAAETEKEICAAFEQSRFALDKKDGNPASQGRIRLNRLRRKYRTLFDRVSDTAVKRMIAGVLRHSKTALAVSLKAMAEHLKIDTGILNPRIKEILIASSNEAAQLIRTIPETYLSEVGNATMRSIVGGTGMEALVPFLAAKYEGNLRKARSVAYDQTRKTFQSVTAERCRAIGIQEFEWVHSGRTGKHARELHRTKYPAKVGGHVGLNGGIFRFDDPPYIGEMYGEAVYGLPATLPNCHCIARPIVQFGEKP